jgi:3-oxoacyl-(acyl-carrier-protein) synthase
MTAGARVAGVSVLTGWGEGLAALPDDAVRAAAGRDVVPIRTPDLTDERFRRATRECLLGVAAAGAALRAIGLAHGEVRGSGTALLYATAGAYGASNRTFIEAAASGAVRFPYTAPSAVPAEVAIEYGLTGSYVILIGGATATLEALWQASTLIARGAAQRALVLAVETFTECADLYARGRRVLARPLVEAAACAVLVPSAQPPAWQPATAAGRLETLAKRRAGETLACAPLIALALGGAEDGPFTLTGQWRGRRAALAWGGQARNEIDQER